MLRVLFFVFYVFFVIFILFFSVPCEFVDFCVLPSSDSISNPRVLKSR